VLDPGVLWTDVRSPPGTAFARFQLAQCAGSDAGSAANPNKATAAKPANAPAQPEGKGGRPSGPRESSAAAAAAAAERGSRAAAQTHALQAGVEVGDTFAIDGVEQCGSSVSVAERYTDQTRRVCLHRPHGSGALIIP
jgi:hypothetical protein